MRPNLELIWAGTDVVRNPKLFQAEVHLDVGGHVTGRISTKVEHDEQDSRNSLM